MVLWNGPLGSIEEGFDEGTNRLARALAASSAHVIVGGGDTVSVIHHMGLAEKFYHVSTGGGAMLTFLATGTLPAIEALLGKKKS
ncbi:MAG: phosphoglycerate kinase [Candidatus Sungbacteria bacterium]|nr:phosphoglycerate kinase [Candidatus Sungbacteria bacterium]